MQNCGLAGPRRFTLLLLERGCLSIRTKARQSNAHHSRPYDRCSVEIPQMPALLRQKRRRRTEGYGGKSHGGELQRNHQGIRRTVRVRMVHQARCATDTRGGQINQPVPCRRHSHGRKKVDQLQERNQRQNCRIICRHLQIFNSVVRVRENKQRCQQYCNALHQRCDRSRLEQPQHRSNFQGVTAPVSACSSNARRPFSIAVGVGGQPGI
jgi:hypothetical protein